MAFVGVEAAAWIRAWGGIRIVARGGLLDNSREKKTHMLKFTLNFVCETTLLVTMNIRYHSKKHWYNRKRCDKPISETKSMNYRECPRKYIIKALSAEIRTCLRTKDIWEKCIGQNFVE